MTFATPTKLTDTYTLSNDVRIPVVGFGTWQTPDGIVARDSVIAALEAGYRHIDTAAFYGNEESVGEAIKSSGVKREDIFLTTKLWNDHHGYNETLASFEASLRRLNVDYVDLFLIHWPNPLEFRETWQQTNADTWRAMEEIYNSGRARAIGVSNFQQHHLDELAKTATTAPMVNQIFLNPSDTQEDLVAYNRAHNILTEAYSPLGTGRIFEVPELQAIASKYGKSIAQVVLRWSLQRGFVPLPKSVHADRIRENTQLFDFQLSENDIEAINGMQGLAGEHKNPDTVDF